MARAERDDRDRRDDRLDDRRDDARDRRETHTRERPRRPARPAMDAREAARSAVRQVGELTGAEPEGVVSLERGEEGWRVGVEVVEIHRIPDTTDVLALYQVTVDDHGDLVSYRRAKRYSRCQSEEGGG
ncbi:MULTISPECIES: gas vesicle protein [Streptomyces]|uniref:Gas vesicle protein n=1 Tax=Streptomyces lonegramiae TaxID=3075524 RepID=A0ABU2X985_9ACTN|nr:gas vesicle protein [Streptomyces sp. DSM 41529]MDT0541690.1 gas vesicle protein [Streptomyces sp. DSM 41529]